MEDGMTNKTYVWSLFTRLFHLFLVLALVVVYLSSEEDNLLSWHVAFGYFMGFLFLGRVAWGFMDVRYSRFRDFNFNIDDLIHYMTHIFSDKKKEYAGHNPAASWAIVAMILLGILAVISGTLAYGTQEGMGVLAFLNSTFFKKMELFEEIHELFANAFMLVVLMHIAGVILDRVLHSKNAIDSMIWGYKKIATPESLTLTLWQKVFGLFWIGVAVGLLVYMLSTPTNVLLADANIPVDYQTEHTLFYDECISCHTLYAPFLLPKKSWVKMMDTLEDHFGDDASLEPEDVASIKAYLVQNSAETSTKEAAFYILESIKSQEDNITLAITKMPYWKEKHERIEASIFKNKKVGKISNCKACHGDFEKGLLNDKDIKIPKG